MLSQAPGPRTQDPRDPPPVTRGPDYYRTLELSSGLRNGRPEALARLRAAVDGAQGPGEVAQRLGLPYRSLCRWRLDIPVVAEILATLKNQAPNGHLRRHT